MIHGAGERATVVFSGGGHTCDERTEYADRFQRRTGRMASNVAWALGPMVTGVRTRPRCTHGRRRVRGKPESPFEVPAAFAAGVPSDAISSELASRRTGMSFQRTRMSADRTLMSVIRTSPRSSASASRSTSSFNT